METNGGELLKTVMELLVVYNAELPEYTKYYKFLKKPVP
jgi:hypothetical protein